MKQKTLKLGRNLQVWTSSSPETVHDRSGTHRREPVLLGLQAVSPKRSPTLARGSEGAVGLVLPPPTRGRSSLGRPRQCPPLRKPRQAAHV